MYKVGLSYAFWSKVVLERLYSEEVNGKFKWNLFLKKDCMHENKNARNLERISIHCVKYLRPVSGCTRGECCDTAAAAAAAAAAEDGDGCLGLLTLVLLLANSSLMVWGKSGSKRTPCCNLTKFSNIWKQLFFQFF